MLSVIECAYCNPACAFVITISIAVPDAATTIDSVTLRRLRRSALARNIVGAYKFFALPQARGEIALDLQAKRSVLRLFTYGMYAVTAQHENKNGVFLANWLSQCSFAPPMLMVSVERASFTGQLIQASGLFAVHVLASGQRELAGMLGKSSRTNARKLDALRWHPSALTQNPILEDTLGYVECRVAAQAAAGDSMVLVGEIIAAELLSHGELAPLTMQETGFKHSG